MKEFKRSSREQKRIDSYFGPMPGKKPTVRKPRAPRVEQPDEAAARELALFIENDGQLYRQQGLPILENLAKKKVKGVYDPVKAAKLYKYLADNGAKKYVKDIGGSPSMFSPDTRRATAKELTRSFDRLTPDEILSYAKKKKR